MTIEAINSRQEAEAKVFDTARQIRALLDAAATIELPDGRDAAEEALTLATEE